MLSNVKNNVRKLNWFKAGIVVEWSRALVQNHLDWKVSSSNPGEGCYGDGELSGSRFSSFLHMAINSYVTSSWCVCIFACFMEDINKKSHDPFLGLLEKIMIKS